MLEGGLVLVKCFKTREHCTLSISGRLGLLYWEKGKVFTPTHIRRVLFFPLWKRTFEPFPVKYRLITAAAFGQFKRLLLLLLLATSPAHQEGGGAYLFVYSVIQFLCPALVFLQRVAKTSLLASWAAARTPHSDTVTSTRWESKDDRERWRNGKTEERERADVRQGEFTEGRAVWMLCNVVAMSRTVITHSHTHTHTNRHV